MIRRISPRNWDLLAAEALTARKAAYAPYSRFKVGAALLCDDGEVVSGCNVENASFGLCLCAERNAMTTAVAQGRGQGIRAMAPPPPPPLPPPAACACSSWPSCARTCPCCW